MTIDYARRDHLPAAVQRRLPLKPGDQTLVDLCAVGPTPGLTPAERRELVLSAKERRDLQHQAQVLLRELDQHPDSLVTYTYDYSDEPDEVRDITVRQLAREQLQEFKDYASEKCRPQLQEQLRSRID
ncbi:MAG: hypothetical protein WD649_02660 [Thermoleophilaceae bacterium]